MRGKTLAQIIELFKVKAGLSLSPAQNIPQLESIKVLLKKAQEDLWDDFDWPFLQKDFDFPAVKDQNIYDLDPSLSLEKIIYINYKYGDVWQPVLAGITNDDYNKHDPEKGETDTVVLKWRVVENESPQDNQGDRIEIWPMPNVDGILPGKEYYIRIRAQRALNPFISSAHRADLDDRLIVYRALLDYTQLEDKKRAYIQQDYNQLLFKLRGRNSKKRIFILSGDDTERVRRHPVYVAKGS